MTTMSKSSGNPFADVGLPNAEELLAKTEAMMFIKVKLRELRIRQVDLAKLANMPESNVSEILSGRLTRYGIDRINRLLAIIDLDARLEVHCVFNREHHTTPAMGI